MLEQDAIEHVERIIKEKSFTQEEQEVLQRMIKAWRGWMAFGKGFKFIVVALGLVAAFALSISQIIESLKNIKDLL